MGTVREKFEWVALCITRGCGAIRQGALNQGAREPGQACDTDEDRGGIHRFSKSEFRAGVTRKVLPDSK